MQIVILIEAGKATLLSDRSTPKHKNLVNSFSYHEALNLTDSCNYTAKSLEVVFR